jgi:hypothetical protein
MKEIQVTLYEIFGYLIPGLVTLAALFLIASSVLEPRLSGLVSGAGQRTLIAIAVGAYLTGHITQALGNLVFGKLKLKENAVAAIPGPLRAALVQHLGEKLGKALPEDVLFDVCDALLVHSGNTANRDIYVYREGFYRGLTIALAVLPLGIALTWFRWKWALPAPSWDCFVFAILVSAGAAHLSFRRFQRFATYRVEGSIYGAAAYFISQAKKEAV